MCKIFIHATLGLLVRYGRSGIYHKLEFEADNNTNNTKWMNECIPLVFDLIVIYSNVNDSNDRKAHCSSQ